MFYSTVRIYSIILGIFMRRFHSPLMLTCNGFYITHTSSNLQGDLSRQEDSLGPLEEQQYGPTHAALPRHDLGPRGPRGGKNPGRSFHSGRSRKLRLRTCSVRDHNKVIVSWEWFNWIHFQGIAAVHDIMIDALAYERSSFIELLVMNGFLMRPFLTVERLRELYNKSVSYCNLDRGLFYK